MLVIILGLQKLVVHPLFAYNLYIPVGCGGMFYENWGSVLTDNWNLKLKCVIVGPDPKLQQPLNNFAFH